MGKHIIILYFCEQDKLAFCNNVPIQLNMVGVKYDVKHYVCADSLRHNLKADQPEITRT